MKRSLPLTLAVALFMEQMDSTVIATSLPAIAADIGTSPVALKLALTAYLVSVAIFIPVSGWMADRFGPKNIFRMAIGVFVIGSIACAFAGSLAAFVAARFLQGMGGAMMTPVARLVLVRATNRAELVQAMSMLTIPALVGPLVGPPVGGFITTFFSWHWIFLINVPIGLIGIFLAGRVLPDVPGQEGGRVDVVGFLLVGMAAAGIVFGLSVVSLPALPLPIGFAVLAAGVFALLAYLRHARRHPTPILDPAMFRNATFRTAIVGGTIFRFGIGAIPFLLPLYFQLVFGLTPLQSGLLTFTSAGGALLMKFLAPSMLRLGGFKSVLIGVALLGGVGTIVNGAFTSETPHLLIGSTLLAAGFFRSLFFTAVNTLVFADIEDRQAGQATAISATMQQVSIAIGVAIAGALLELTPMLTGQSLGRETFVVAFTASGLLSISAAFVFLSLDRDAGSNVSGHQLRKTNDAVEAAVQPPNV